MCWKNNYKNREHIMTEWIWDGEMDCGWEDLSQLLKKNCEKFTKTMLETTKFSPIEESKNLITDECMKRFESIVKILAEDIQDGSYYHQEDLLENTHNAIKLNCWIILGSLTETTLQLFLAFYLDDYKNTKWQQWENFKVEQVRKPIIEKIQQLVDEGILDQLQARSLKKAIKDTIKNHTCEHDVQKIMLDELIQLFAKLELFDEEEISYLQQIQSNRNGVHTFQRRVIGTWTDLQFCVRFFCFLLEWVLFHLPDVPDEAYYYEY